MTNRHPLTLALCLAALLTGALAFAAGAPETPRIAFEKFVLPNGLQVILHEDHRLPNVHVNMWFHVGSKDEKPGRTGLAHLFEHIMFEGSRNAKGDYWVYAEKAGANIMTGGVNGTTSNDRTNYFITLPAGNLEYALWLESDRLATLGDSLTQEGLDKQREVVRNERRQGMENSPYAKVWPLIGEGLYGKGHPYSWPIIGSHEDLMAASLQDVKDFFKRYYTPNNLTLTIAGDFDPAVVKPLVEKYFAPIPAGAPLERVRRWVPGLQGEKIINARDRVPQMATFLVWPAPPYFDADEAPLDMASTVLSDGLASRLQKALVYDKPLCTSVGCGNQSLEICGAFLVQAMARPGSSLREIEGIIDREIARLAQEGPTQSELDRAKAKWETGFLSSLERMGGFGGKADMLNQYNTYLGDPDRFGQDVARYRAVTVESCRRAVARWLGNRNRLIVRVYPEASTRETPTDLDRSVIPALGTDRDFTAPTVKTARLANGLEVLVVEKPELPKVNVQFITRAGAVTDNPARTGTATMATALMPLGTRGRDALALENAMGDLGTGLGSYAGTETAGLSFSALKRFVAPALDILADVALNPTFPESELTRERKRALDNLAQEENDPQSLAFRLMPMLVNGREHPYGRPNSGDEASLRSLQRADLVAYHQKWWKPGSSALLFVGDITLDEAVALARKSLGAWAGGAAPEAPLPDRQPATPGRIYLVDRQGAPQSVVLQVMPAPPRAAAAFDALTLADSVWGGSFGSRLNLSLRETMGATYGANSFLSQGRRAGMWGAYTAVQTDKTAEALVEMNKLLADIHADRPIAEQELEDNRVNLVRSYAQEFETLGGVGGKVSRLWGIGLPFGELQREPEGLKAATLAEVNAAASRWADPAQACVLIVGDRQVVEPMLQAAGLRDLVVLDAQGRPIAP